MKKFQTKKQLLAQYYSECSFEYLLLLVVRVLLLIATLIIAASLLLGYSFFENPLSHIGVNFFLYISCSVLLKSDMIKWAEQHDIDLDVT